MTALRSGFTTGACAAAAAKAAAIALHENRLMESVDIPFPDGSRHVFTIQSPSLSPASATVKKFSGDDPDNTNGVFITTTVARNNTGELLFHAGEGVGTVTKPGLQIPPGQPAINPGPRRMIEAALREVTAGGLDITISIAGGRELAAKTFNPRLGIVNGLSVLGTTGIVRPYSAPALRDALLCNLNVALAAGVTAPVFVPGNIGHRAALAHTRAIPDQIIEVSNEWGFMLDQAARQPWKALLLAGHPGKLAKLAEGHWETHSSQSPSVLPFLQQLAASLGITASTEGATAEGLFNGLPEPRRKTLAERLAEDVRKAASMRTGKSCAVMLVAMNGDILGTGGDLSPWL